MEVAQEPRGHSSSHTGIPPEGTEVGSESVLVLGTRSLSHHHLIISKHLGAKRIMIVKVCIMGQLVRMHGLELWING